MNYQSLNWINPSQGLIFASLPFLRYNSPKWRACLPFGGTSIKNKISKIDEKTYKVIFTNIEPNYTDIFYICFDNILSDSGPKYFPAYFPFIKKITNSDELKWYTKAQLRIIRNTIYALHGYQFKSEDLKNLFIVVGKDWNPTYTERIKSGFSEESLSEIEKENIRIILEEENKR